MKKTHIIGIIIIALAIGSLIALLGNTSSYSDFTQAAATQSEVHVVGKLNRAKPVDYNPEVNANMCSFYMTDNSGKECHVVLMKSQPADFKTSDQVVVIGTMQGGTFIANDILMKCPSKYNDGSKQQVVTQ